MFSGLDGVKRVTYRIKLMSHFMRDCRRPFPAHQTAISGPSCAPDSRGHNQLTTTPM